METTDREYRNSMECPMEALSMELFGFDGEPMTDAEIVEHATKKIKMLREMLWSTGMNKELITACIRN